jgi:hypothetical protein
MTAPLTEAVRQILVEDGRPLIAARDLKALLLGIYAGEYSERVEVRVRKREPSDADLSKATQRLRDTRVLREDPDFGPGFYQVFDVLEQPAEAVCCEADSFCYVSHLSAMQLHGLTERSPTHLVLTRPDETLWRQMRDKTMNSSPSGGRPRSRYSFPEQVRGRPILVHDTRHPGVWGAAGPRVRVATIGQTFLDMVVRPGWCGGTTHVLEVWEREAYRHLEELVTTINAYPVKLPKVRAGFILDEILGISDERVLAWHAFAQRGGSQKLDPEKPYAPTYSEKWMLSLNA